MPTAVLREAESMALMMHGQICIALKRIFVHEKIFDEFRDAMVKATEQLKVGEGNEDDVFLGPIQNEMQYNRVKGFFEDVKKENYKVVAGGENPEGKSQYPSIVSSLLICRHRKGLFHYANDRRPPR